MKKKIIISVFFCVLIVVTAASFIIAGIESYNYDMDPANGVDIMEGFGAVFAILIGGYAVFYELDLFFTVYYFFVKPKTKTKTILNIVSNLTLLLIVFSDPIVDVLYRAFHIFKEDWIFPILLFWIYIMLRLVYFMVSVSFSDKEE